MIHQYETLGARSYYQLDNNSNKTWNNIGDLLLGNEITGAKIDPVAVLGVLMKNYPLASRTMVQGIAKTPWMAKPDDNGGWLKADLPLHHHNQLPNDDIAQIFYKKLKQEALGYVGGKKSLGILLSGGMDSRIVAGIIRDLQNSGEYIGQIVAISWGLANTRDVVYSERIAGQFGWDYIHLPLDAETLYQNITLTGQLGAEFSPVHLHAMPAVARLTGIDAILAGSYGDSIGRGEYSGRKVDQLPDILKNDLNQFSLMLQAAQHDSLALLKQDLILSRAEFPNRSEYAYREIEMQLHYMRRQLNSCMSVIDDKIPLYQMFSHPDVFGFMWSLAPQCRNDDVYEALLKLLPGNLLDIPWARTGKPYNSLEQCKAEDTYPKAYHNYGRWLRQDCRSDVITHIQSGALQQLGIFNESALDMWCKSWPKNNAPKANRLDEKMAWLASLAIFVKKYDVAGVEQYSSDYLDKISQLKSLGHTWAYHKAIHLLKR